MTEPTAAPTAVPGLFSRAIAVIVSPKGLFEKLTQQPRVLGALLLVGFMIGFGQGIPQLTERGKQAALDAAVQQTERFTGRPVTDEQYAAMQRSMPIRAYGTIIATPAFVALVTLFFAGLYFVIFNVVLGGTATFKHVMSVVSHAGIIGALGIVLAAPIQYMQGTMTPMGPFTLSALLPMLDENSFLARFLGFLSVFSIWQTIVTAIGFAVLYRRKTSNIAIGLLALTALFAAIGATVMGFFTRR